MSVWRVQPRMSSTKSTLLLKGLTSSGLWKSHSMEQRHGITLCRRRVFFGGLREYW